MCFELGSCFGKARREDLGGERLTSKAVRGARGQGRRADHGNGHYSGTDRKVPAPPYNHQLGAAFDEAGHKAYHDGARKDNHVAAAIGGGYTAYVQDKQADTETPKLSAWHNKVGNEAGYTYTARPHEAADDHRENAPADYHHYPTTTTTNTTTS